MERFESCKVSYLVFSLKKVRKRRSQLQTHVDAMAEQTEHAKCDQVVAVARRISWSQYLTQHPVSLWSNKDICEWLESIGLGHLCPVFARFNGDTLLSLTDRAIDEVLSNHNPIVKELGSAYEIADKVNFKLQLERLRYRVPLPYRCYNFFSSTFWMIGPKIQSELASKISSRSVERAIALTAVAFAAAATTGFFAFEWNAPKRTKKIKVEVE